MIQAKTSPDRTLPARRILALSVPKAGKAVHLTADAVALQQIAAHLGLASCDSLTVECTVLPTRGDILSVSGSLSADLLQTCIVSLESFPVHIEEPIEALFAPPEKLGPITRAEVERTLDDVDPPEPLEDGSIDLWAIAIDHLAVALDPYPRKPGSEIPPELEPEDKESPFAILAALKKGLEKS